MGQRLRAAAARDVQSGAVRCHTGGTVARTHRRGHRSGERAGYEVHRSGADRPVQPCGRIDARDGAAYRADVVLPYATDGTQYLVHLFINFSAHTYTVTIGHFNDPFPVTIATDYAFRSEQAMMS